MSLIALYYVCSVELEFPELNKNDHFTVKLSFLISLSLYFAPFRCQKSSSDNEMARNIARVKLKTIISL